MNLKKLEKSYDDDNLLKNIVKTVLKKYKKNNKQDDVLFKRR